jgi:hypothetical protein
MEGEASSSLGRRDASQGRVLRKGIIEGEGNDGMREVVPPVHGDLWLLTLWMVDSVRIY